MKFNKLTSEWKYLEDELNFQTKIIEKVSPEFHAEVHKEIKNLGKEELLAPDNKSPKLNRAQRRAAKKASKATQDIFKKIAKEIHPDKLVGTEESEKQNKENIFLEATAAKEEDNLLKLFSIAKDLRIDIGDLTPEQVSVFEKEIADLRTKVAMNEKSWIYMWASSENEMREKIIKGYTKFFIENKNNIDSEE